jgi:hypothetical protein
MISDEELIRRATEVVNPRRLSPTAEVGGVGSALVTDNGKVEVHDERSLRSLRRVMLRDSSLVGPPPFNVSISPLFLPGVSSFPMSAVCRYGHERIESAP